MVFLKQIGNTITSSIKTHDMNEPSPIFRKKRTVDGDEMQPGDQKAAQNLIRQSPSAAQGYLASAQVYQQQNDLHAAMDVYKQALHFVSPNDPKYLQLKEEKHSISEILARYDNGFHQLLPFDVLSLIFGQLSIEDLLRCTDVCDAWLLFLKDWSGFWNQVSARIRQASIEHTTVDPFISGDIDELRITGLIDIKLLCYTLRFIERTDNRSIRKLCFDKMIFSNGIAFNLAKALRLVSSSVKCVVFTDCVTTEKKAVSTILEACTGMTHISLSESNFRPRTSTLKKPRQKDIIVPANPYSSLTYLRLTSSYSIIGYDKCQYFTGRLSGMLQQCPNLVHLFLDSGLSVYQGHCIKQAVKHCLRLRNLVVSDNAEMPETIIDHVKEDEYRIFDKKAPPEQPQAIRLRRFVFTAMLTSYEPDDIISTYATTHETLQLLSLQYCRSPTLLKLARYNASSLREIRLTVKNGVLRMLERDPPMDLTLAALFAACPALEAIKIGDKFNIGGPDALHAHYIYANDIVLKAIAENCNKLRYLEIISRRHHTSKGILYFAKVGGSKLTYLAIDTDQTIVLLLVRALKSLQQLHIRNDSLFTVNNTPISTYDRTNAQRILQVRGGSLLIDL